MNVTDLLKHPNQNERLSRLLLESVKDYAIFTTDLNGRVTSWNAGSEAILGYAESEIIGRSAELFFTTEDLAHGRHIEELKEALENGVAEDERWHVRKDGSLFWASGRVTRLVGDQEEVIGFAKVMRDITERRLKERALKHSEERFRVMADTIPGVLFTALPDGTCDYFNQWFYDYAGLHTDVNAAKAWRQVLHPEDTTRNYGVWQRAVSFGTAFHVEHRLKAANGDYRWFFAKWRPLHGESGQLTKWFGACIDINDRKLAEDELFRRKQEFKALVENSPDVITRLDKKFRHLYINPRADRAFGIPPSNFIGKTKSEVGFPGSVCGSLESLYREVFEIGEERTLDFRMEVENDVIFFNDRIVPELDKEGMVSTLLEITSDITNQQRAEEALRVSEERFRAAFEQAAVGIVQIAPDGRLIFANPGFCKIIGYTQEEASVLTASDITQPEDLEVDDAYMRRMLAGGIPTYTLEKRYLRKDKSCVWVNSTSSLVRKASGEPYYAMAIVEDISQRRQAEEQLRNAHDELERRVAERTEDLSKANVLLVHEISERRQTEEALRATNQILQALIQASPLAIVTLDALACVTTWNQASTRIFGWAEQEVLGRPLTDISTGDRDTFDVVFLASLKGRSQIGMEAQGTRKDGSPVYVNVWTAPLWDAYGNVTAVMGIITDISEQKRSEMEREFLLKDIRKMSAELMLAEERERCQLAEDLHDDLGQLLTLAKIKLSTLQQAQEQVNLDNALADVIELIGKANQRVRSLTFQLSPPILRDLGLIRALEWLVEDFKKTYRLTIDMQDDGTPKPLDEQVSMILFRSVREALINVAKHAHTDKAELKLMRAGTSLKLIIKDDGVGFDVYTKLQATEHQSFGLFSIRERLSYMGGNTELCSIPGVGTEVTLTVPLFLQ